MSRKAGVRDRSHVPPPSLDEGVNHSVFVSPADAKVDIAVEDGGPEVYVAMITVPLAAPTILDGYQSTPFQKRLAAKNLTADQWKVYRNILSGLAKSGAQLKDGTVVNCGSDVVKWILENIKPTGHRVR